jgi:hypothetical protein
MNFLNKTKHNKFLLIFLWLNTFIFCSVYAQNNDTINQFKDGARNGYWIINGDLANNENYVQ